MIIYTVRCDRSDRAGSQCSQQSPAHAPAPSWCSTMRKQIPAPCPGAQRAQSLWDWEKSYFLLMLSSSCPAHPSRTLLSFRNKNILMCVCFITENHAQSKSVVNHMEKNYLQEKRFPKHSSQLCNNLLLVWGENGAKQRLQHVQCSLTAPVTENGPVSQTGISGNILIPKTVY